MNITDIIQVVRLNGLSLTIKAIGIVFGIFYLIYAIVYYQQLNKMNRAFQSPQNKLLFSLGLLQIFIGSGVLLFAFLLL